MNTTTITTNSTQKYDQILSQLSNLDPHLHLLLSPTNNSITFFTHSTIQTNHLLDQLTHLLHLTPFHRSCALAA